MVWLFCGMLFLIVGVFCGCSWVIRNLFNCVRMFCWVFNCCCCWFIWSLSLFIFVCNCVCFVFMVLILLFVCLEELLLFRSWRDFNFLVRERVWLRVFGFFCLRYSLLFLLFKVLIKCWIVNCFCMGVFKFWYVRFIIEWIFVVNICKFLFLNCWWFNSLVWCNLVCFFMLKWSCNFVIILLYCW